MNQGWDYCEQVTRRDDGRSLLDYYSQRYPHSSREDWQTRIDQGQIWVNGQPETASFLLRLGQQLTYHRPPWQEPAVPLEFDVLHDDPDVLVVAKPAGLPVLPGGGFLQHTLLAQLQQRYPQDTPTPVHRLGRGTSGLVLLARSPLAKSSLSQQMRDHTQQASLLLHSLFNLRKDFCSEHDSETRSELRSSQCSQICVHPDSNPSSNLSSHRDPHLHSRWYSADDFLENMSNDRGVPAAEHRLLRKTYLALIGASDLPDHFTITQPIGKLPYPTLGYVYGATPDGRPAYSEGRVLWREGDRTLLEITILTGRPHQIRIHLASVGYPLLGDPLYAAGGVPHLAAVSPAAKLPVPGDCGYWLHAHQLTFRHPATGEPMHFTSPAPVFTSAREAWQFLGS